MKQEEPSQEAPSGMSKILAAEIKRPSSLSPQAPAPPASPEAIDAAAAWHIELLSRTDAKLDQFSARLDRVFAEMGRLSPASRSGEPRASLVASPPSRWPLVRLVLVCGVLVAGILNAETLRQWADRYLPVDVAQAPPARVATLPPPVPAPVVPPQRVGFMMKAPTLLAPRIPVPAPVALLESAAPTPAPAPPPAAPEPPPASAAPAESAPASIVVQPVNGRIHI